jgi:hypothetical protein
MINFSTDQILHSSAMVGDDRWSMEDHPRLTEAGMMDLSSQTAGILEVPRLPELLAPPSTIGCALWPLAWRWYGRFCGHPSRFAELRRWLDLDVCGGMCQSIHCWRRLALMARKSLGWQDSPEDNNLSPSCHDITYQYFPKGSPSTCEAPCTDLQLNGHNYQDKDIPRTGMSSLTHQGQEKSAVCSISRTVIRILREMKYGN